MEELLEINIKTWKDWAFSNNVPESGSFLLGKGIIFNSACINAFTNSTPTRKTDSRGCC